MVFIDESGLSERPHRVRTWAPRGQTPVLQYHFNWKVLSVTAGMTWWNFYFRLYPRAIRAPQVVDFLGHLLRHLPGKLLVVWDGLPAHRARLVRDFVRAQRGRSSSSGCRLRPRTQSGGVHLGLLETPRTAQLLSARFRPARLSSPPRIAPHAPPPTAGARLLASSRTVATICGLNRAVVNGRRAEAGVAHRWTPSVARRSGNSLPRSETSPPKRRGGMGLEDSRDRGLAPFSC